MRAFLIYLIIALFNRLKLLDLSTIHVNEINVPILLNFFSPYNKGEREMQT